MTRGLLLLMSAACNGDPYFIGIDQERVIACVIAERPPEEDLCAPDQCRWVEADECPSGYEATCYTELGEVHLYDRWSCLSRLCER